MYRALGALFLVLFLAAPAEARKRVYHAHPDCNVLWPCEGVGPSPRGERVVKAMGGFGSARKVYTPRAEARVKPRRAVARHRAPSVTQTLVRAATGIVAPLAAKVAEIQTSCGSRVVSALRHTRVAGTRTMSLHASGQAVDIAGNPSCIYAALSGWAGGYSTDYSRVAHVHISWGGREHGVRFVHDGHRHARHHARHRHPRYAAAR